MIPLSMHKIYCTSLYTRYIGRPSMSGVLLCVVKATSPAEERQDVTVLYNKMTLSELQDTFSLNVGADCSPPPWSLALEFPPIHLMNSLSSLVSVQAQSVLSLPLGHPYAISV